MLVKRVENPRKISAQLSEEELSLCKDYIKGAVHGFTNNNSNEKFYVCSLFGGENTLWKDTPLNYIYQYHYNKTKDYKKAHDSSAKDVGYLLKLVLCEDEKFYYEEFDAYTREYCRLSIK